MSVIHSASDSAPWTFFDCSSPGLPRLSSRSSVAAPNTAIVAGSMWIWRCSMKPPIVHAMTNSDCLSNRGSVIVSRSLKLITWRRFSSVACRWRPHMK